MSNENVSSTSTPLKKNHTTKRIKDVAVSPSSTTMSESGGSTSFHQRDDIAVRGTQISAGLPTARKIMIRSDPALLTCFDAADKPLYDLWAPKV